MTRTQVQKVDELVKKGMSVKDASKKVGVHFTTYYKYRNGSSKVTKAKAKKTVAKVTKAKYDQALRDIEVVQGYNKIFREENQAFRQEVSDLRLLIVALNKKLYRLGETNV